MARKRYFEDYQFWLVREFEMHCNIGKDVVSAYAIELNLYE